MYPIRTQKLYALLCLLVFSSVAAYGQANNTATSGCARTPSACFAGAATEDFANGACNFTSTASSGAAFSYNAAGKNLQVGGATPVNTTRSATISIDTRNFLGAATSQAGFTLSGTANIASIQVQVISAINSVVLASCPATTFANGNPSEAATIATSCFSRTDADVSGQRVFFRILIVLKNNGQGGEGTLAFDDFRTNLAEIVVTPVTFVGFEGRETKQGVNLTWHVADEVNVATYEIERSGTAGRGFVKIGSVPATGGTIYSFTDGATRSGRAFYRIKNVDGDGAFKYSNMISFEKGAGAMVVRVIPTVVTSKTAVEHPTAKGVERITLSTGDGRLVRSLRPAAGSVKTTLEMSDLRPGLYLLKWHDGSGAVQTTKVVKH